MIQRARMMSDSKIDYEKEKTRPMCEGCERCIYAAPPGMYVRANECPFNLRKRMPDHIKRRVGQQKQR